MYLKSKNIIFIILKIFIFLNLIQFINCKYVNVNTKTNKNNKREESENFPVKVSIIIPTYNSAQFLNRTISSALNQTLTDIEVILVNDHSTDNTIELVKIFENDKRFRFFTLDQNYGPSVARNVGLELAKGEFIGFIDSDDYVSYNYFESLYNLSKDKDVVLGIFVNSTNDTDEYIHHGKFKTVGYGCVGDTLWRKSFLDKYNIRFDRDSKLGEDLNFRTAVMKKRPRKIKSPDVGAYYFYKRREGSLMNYDPMYIEYMSNQIKLGIHNVDDSNVLKTVIIVASCLSVVGLASAFIVYKYKFSNHAPKIDDEREGLITTI